MPRSVNTAGLQSAFAQLGQANSRLANLEFQDRERRRQERAQIGGIAGGALGGYFGGPAGAQAGSLVGSQLAGGTVSGAAPGAALGGTIAAQRSQAEQEQRQQQSLAALQQARSDAAQQRRIETGEAVQPAFFETFQPAARTPEQIAQAEAQPFMPPIQQAGGLQPIPPPAIAQPAAPMQPQPQRPGLLGLSIPELDIQRRPQAEAVPVAPVPAPPLAQAEAAPVAPVQPTPEQVARSRQEQQQMAGLSTLATAPFVVPRRQPARDETAFQGLIREGEDRLAIERAALGDPRLTRFPEAFAAQQQRVDQTQGQLDQLKRQGALLTERERTALGRTSVRGQQAVTDQYANFLEKRATAQDVRQFDALNRDLSGLRRSGVITGKQFLEESESLRKGRIDALERRISGEENINKRASSLRKDFRQETKDLQKAQQAYRKMEGLIKDPAKTGPKDLSIIITYLKTLDPPSVARESEVDAVRNAVSVLDRFKNLSGKALKGQLVSETTRNQIFEAAKILNDVARDQEKNIISDYVTLGERQNVSRNKVFTDREIMDKLDLNGLDDAQKGAVRKSLVPLIGQTDEDTGDIITIETVENVIRQRLKR